jgi:hypothetical protein
VRIYDKPVAITLTDTNGRITGRSPWPQPKPGDVLDVYSLDYAGNHLHRNAGDRRRALPPSCVTAWLPMSDSSS